MNKKSCQPISIKSLLYSYARHCALEREDSIIIIIINKTDVAFTRAEFKIWWERTKMKQVTTVRLIHAMTAEAEDRRRCGRQERGAQCV